MKYRGCARVLLLTRRAVWASANSVGEIVAFGGGDYGSVVFPHFLTEAGRALSKPAQRNKEPGLGGRGTRSRGAEVLVDSPAPASRWDASSAGAKCAIARDSRGVGRRPKRSVIFSGAMTGAPFVAFQYLRASRQLHGTVVFGVWKSG